MFNNTFTKRYKSIPIARYAYSCGQTTYSNFLTFPELHKEFEMIYIKDGEALLTINSHTYPVQSGDLIFISPYTLHGLELPPQESFSHICYCFDLSLLSTTTLLNDLESNTFTIINHIASDSPHNNALRKCFLEINDAMVTSMPYWELTVRGNLALMFAYFMQHNLTSSAISSSFDRDFCTKVYKHVELHYNEQINSETVARSLDYNQSYFCRLFKKNYLMCFSEFLNMYRIEKSKALLRNPLLSITDITYEVGFTSPSYFTKIFRQQNGISPKAFRDTYF